MSAGLDTSTSTPGMTALLASRTRPVMAPVSACGAAGAATRHAVAATRRARRIRARFMIPPCCLLRARARRFGSVGRHRAERFGAGLLPRVVPQAQRLHRIRVLRRLDVVVGDANVRVVLALIVRLGGD